LGRFDELREVTAGGGGGKGFHEER
jgi:hypothetical protein